MMHVNHSKLAFTRVKSLPNYWGWQQAHINIPHVWLQLQGTEASKQVEEGSRLAYIINAT